MIQLQGNSYENFSVNEMGIYLQGAQFLTTGSTDEKKIHNKEQAQRHFTHYSRALEYLKTFSQTKAITEQELQEFIAELQRIKEEDPRSKS